MKQTLVERKDGRLVYTATFDPDFSSCSDAETLLDKILNVFDYEKKNTIQYNNENSINKIFIVGERIGSELNSIFLAEDNGKGIPGNGNEELMRYHGWRGSWNDIGTYGCGLRLVEKVTFKEGDEKHISKISIIFGKDVAKKEA